VAFSAISATAARERETLLLQMLSQMQQQNQRLLDMPRHTPSLSPQEATGATQTHTPFRQPRIQDALQRQPGAPLADARGAIRRRIVVLLREHPAGLTPAEIRDGLGIDWN
jgi:hypothetical protein